MHNLDAVLRTNLARLLALGYLNAPAGKTAQEAWIAVMAEDLADSSPDDVEAAFCAYRRSPDPADRYMPNPGRIRSLTPAAVMLTEAKGQAGEAWQAVVRASGNCRRGHELIRTPAIWGAQLPPEAVLLATEAAVAAVGGWEHVGMHMDRERALGLAFRRAYEAHLSRQGAPHRRLPDVSATPQIAGPTDG